MKPVSEMNRYELDELQDQINYRLLVLAAAEVEAAGIHATCEVQGDTPDYVLVYSPVDELPNAWAPPQECRRLMDTIANLTPVEAYKRWYPKVTDKYPSKPYTQGDAIRDTRAARDALKRQYANGEIDGQMYADLYKSSSFMDLVK